MTNPFAKYEQDVIRARVGVPVVIDGMTFIMRAAGGHNRAFRYALGLASQARRKDLENNTDPFAAINASAEIYQDAFAETVVVDWSGIEGRDGQPLEFSKENFLDLVRSCPDLWDKIMEAGNNPELFRLPSGSNLGKS